MSPPYAVTTARLGALVREQREALGMSMDQLAKQARVSRSSVHRLEHGSDIRPTPSKLGRMLQVVGLEADAVRAALEDSEYRDDVLTWMSRSDDSTTLVDELERSRPSTTPDLVALHPDGAVARIQGDDHLDEIGEMFKRAGWLVTRPT